MSQSAIFDALQLVGDALQDGRLDDAEGVLAEVDAMEAWDFEHRRHVAVPDLLDFSATYGATFTEYNPGAALTIETTREIERVGLHGIDS